MSDNPLSSGAFVDFLIEHAQVPESGHYWHAINAINNASLEQISSEIYQALIDVFVAYPEVVSLQPQWTPVIDEQDSSIVARFRIVMQWREGEKVFKQTLGYDDCPSCLENAYGPQAYNALVQAGEFVDMPVWNDFIHYNLFTRENPYGSAEEVRAEMKHECGHFIALRDAWLLQQKTLEAPPQMRPSPRI